jgi:hypothetical protein
MFLLPEPTRALFDGSRLFDVAIVVVRITLGAVLGVYGYLFIFETPNSK